MPNNTCESTYRILHALVTTDDAQSSVLTRLCKMRYIAAGVHRHENEMRAR